MGNKLRTDNIDTNNVKSIADEEQPFIFSHGIHQYPIAKSILASKSLYFKNLDHYSREWEGSRQTSPYALDDEMEEVVAIAFVALIRGDTVVLESKKNLMQLLSAIDKYRIAVPHGKIMANFSVAESYDREETLKILRYAKHLVLYQYSAFDLRGLFRKSDRELLQCLTDEDVAVWMGHLLDANTDECYERVAMAYATLDAKDLYEWSLAVTRVKLIRACEMLAKYRNVEPVAVRMDFAASGLHNKVPINGEDLGAYQMSILPYLDLIWIQDYKKDLLLNAEVSYELFMAICKHFRHATKTMDQQGMPESDLVRLIAGGGDTLEADKKWWNDREFEQRVDMLSIYIERCQKVMGVDFSISDNDFRPHFVEGEVAHIMSIISHNIAIGPESYKQMLRVMYFYNTQVVEASKRR